MNRQRSIIELEIDQYCRLLQIRKLLSFVLLILIVSWIFLTSFAGSISFQNDPIRIVLVVFIGIVAPTLLATNLYGLKEKDKYCP
jgi:RsiW-degrading membrane proteinase PrsW (M82 family)